MFTVIEMEREQERERKTKKQKQRNSHFSVQNPALDSCSEKMLISLQWTLGPYLIWIPAVSLVPCLTTYPLTASPPTAEAFLLSFSPSGMLPLHLVYSSWSWYIHCSIPSGLYTNVIDWETFPDLPLKRNSSSQNQTYTPMPRLYFPPEHHVTYMYILFPCLLYWRW